MTSWTSLPTEEAFITLRALGRVALTGLVDLRDKLTKPDGFLRCMGSSNILGFSGGGGHKGLLLGAPGDGTSINEESISGYHMPVLVCVRLT